jgi:hypothetical protein
MEGSGVVRGAAIAADGDDKQGIAIEVAQQKTCGCCIANPQVSQNGVVKECFNPLLPKSARRLSHLFRRCEYEPRSEYR